MLSYSENGRTSLVTLLANEVADELHAYRGRQGADVAFLVRRVRDACEAPDLQCVGTSATMTSGGSLADQRRLIAGIASRMFGAEVTGAGDR